MMFIRFVAHYSVILPPLLLILPPLLSALPLCVLPISCLSVKYRFFLLFKGITDSQLEFQHDIRLLFRDTCSLTAFKGLALLAFSKMRALGITAGVLLSLQELHDHLSFLLPRTGGKKRKKQTNKKPQNFSSSIFNICTHGLMNFTEFK